MRLTVMKNAYAICKLDNDSPIPPWVNASHGFASMTYTQDELSIICDEVHVPPEIEQERGWRIIKVIGPLDFSLVGVISKITGILAHAGVCLFTVSTYETDFILVRQDSLDIAVRALKEAEMEIID